VDGRRFDGILKAGARLPRGRFLKLAAAAALGLAPGLRRRDAGAQWAPLCQGEGAFCAMWVSCCGGLYCVANSAWGLTGTCSATQPAETAPVTTETARSGNGHGKKKHRKSRGNGQWHEADSGDGGSQKPQSGGPRKREHRKSWGRRQYERRKRRGML